MSSHVAAIKQSTCSTCGHWIIGHYPNFEDEEPVSFYCGHGVCDCTRPESAIEWAEIEGRVGAVQERGRRAVVWRWYMRVVCAVWALIVLGAGVFAATTSGTPIWVLLPFWIVVAPVALVLVWYWWVVA